MSLGGWALASDYQPAREIGGDFLDAFPIGEGALDAMPPRRLGLVIADVSGKGISAALLMAFVRPILRTAMDRNGDPVAALERTNWILAAERHTGLFVTAISSLVDLDSGEALIGNAGHEPPILIRADGTVSEIDGGGPLLGAFGRLDLTPTRIQLEPGDRLLLYTDGVTDAQSPSGERFGLPRLLATVGSRPGEASPDSVVTAITGELAAFRGAAEPADDIALLVAGRAP